jgi:hypothetical protein
MGGKRHDERSQLVSRLCDVAARHSIQRVEKNAGRERVGKLVETLLKLKKLSEADTKEIKEAWAAFQSTYSAGATASNTAEAESSAAEPKQSNASSKKSTKEWKFQAAQFTYNKTTGDWASHDASVLKALFDRFVQFVLQVGSTLMAKGLSATMEESGELGEHVHLHWFFHSEQAFHKEGPDALSNFVFEGVHPHVAPNRASGKAFAGAVKFGHFYVVVDKLGSLHSWTNHAPFKRYGVEGWWLDNLLKAGKLSRNVYLSWAARVNVGFMKRLTDVRAAELRAEAST